MSEAFYHFILAVATSYCAYVNSNKVSKVLFTISTVCWWLLFVGDIVGKIV